MEVNTMSQLGRPKKKETLVPLMIMVPVATKRYLQLDAEVKKISLSALARQILVHYWATR